MKFLFTRRFNFFDQCVIMFFTMLLVGGHPIMACLVLIVGVIASVVGEHAAGTLPK